MDLACTVRAEDIGSAPARTRTLSSWVIPDLALLASFITLIYCLFLFDGTRQLFRDSDAGWHIRNGEAILSGAGFPRADPYSFSRAGQPWFAWEWGSDVLTGAAHLAGGPAFVAGVYALAIAACTWLWFRLHWTNASHFLIAAALAVPLLTTVNIHWHARPHIFGWLLLLIAVLLCEGPTRSLFSVGVLSVLWTNLHASFFLLPVLLLIYSGSYLVRSLLWSEFDRRADSREARWFSTAATLALLVSLLNPYGIALHQHVFRYLTDRELIDRIGEFQSFNFHVSGSWQIVAALSLGAVGCILQFGQKKLAHCVLSALLLILALRSARVLPVAALVTLPLAGGAITQALRDWSGIRAPVRRGLDAFLAYGVNLRKLDARFGGLALAPVSAALCFALLGFPAVSAHAGFPPDSFPVEAASRVQSLPENARILAPDMYGGYLIYRFSGARKVWFDGRSDFYGSAFMKDYIALIEVRPGWRSKLAGFRFTHALLPSRYSLLPALQATGWTTLHSDSVATLLQAPRVSED